MVNFEDKNTPYHKLSRRAKFVNTVWTTPIVAVMLLLILLIDAFSTSFKIWTISIIITAHLIQYVYTFIQWRKEQGKTS